MSTATTVQNWTTDLDPQLLWECLESDSGARVGVMTRSGTFVFMNRDLARLFGLTEMPESGTAALHDALPAAMAVEIRGHAREALMTGAPRRVDLVIKGQHGRVTLRPLSMEFEGEPCVLFVAQRTYRGAPADNGEQVHESHCEDLGPLSVLTPREREILGLIGEGLTSAQIAERLSRSVKTVEWHRVSIGHKLGTRRRIELAQIAMICGLCSPPEPGSPRRMRERLVVEANGVA